MTKADAARMNGQSGGRPSNTDATATPPLPLDPRSATAPPALTLLPPKVALAVAYYCGPANLNMTDAYAMAGYVRHRENAARLFRRPAVAAAIAALLGSRIDEVTTMGGEEATKRLSVLGRFDITDALPETDPIRQWPAHLRLCIKAIKPTRYGRQVEFHDPVKPIELLAKIGGKLKDTVVLERNLEDIIVAANALADPTRVDSPADAPAAGA